METSRPDDPSAAELSDSARRLLHRPRPRFRGFLHRWAAIFSIPFGIVMVTLADGGRAKVSLAVFAFGATAMLGVSAVVHLRDWPRERVEVLVRLDHSTIFLAFATSATPIALLAFDGSRSATLFWFAWVGALLGIVAEWVPMHPPAGVMNAVYLIFGGSFLAFLPWLWDALTDQQIALLLGGGAAYTIGSLIVGSQWPNLWPNSVGYHEIWHVLVAVGVGSHYVIAYQLAN